MTNLKSQISNDKGQAILALILIMTVALAIGLSVVQKSLVDVSTSTKVEESSRAFSAAEAGIEKALQPGSTCGANCISFSENSSKADVAGGNLIPCIPGSPGCTQTSGQQQVSLEYPPLAKEEVAHIWLANFDSKDNPPTEVYKQNSLDVYWGNSQTDKPALELTLVYFESSGYKSKKWYLDSDAISHANNFDTASCPGGIIVGSNTYQCHVKIGDATGDPSFSKNGVLLPSLMLIRARLLYNTTSQPFAVQAPYPCAGTSGNNCFIPPQARIFTSTGISGETQRKVKVFQIQKVVPPYFDYAIFSLGAISK